MDITKKMRIESIIDNIKCEMSIDGFEGDYESLKLILFKYEIDLIIKALKKELERMI